MQARINGVTLSFDVEGPEAAPTVVLHHPLATARGSWDALAAALRARYRVVRFDARGHGTSEAPTGAYAFETLAGDVIALMDHVGIERAHFVGLSMGGMVGQYLGLLHPDRVRSLCLIATTSRVPPEALPLWDQRITDAAEKGMASVVEGALARWITPVTKRDNPALAAALTAMILATPAAGYIGWCHAIRRLDITGRLSAIRTPTRVIVGAEDPGTPPSAAEAIQRGIPGADLVVIPGVSHMIHLEAPAMLEPHVTSFLARQPA